MILHYRVSNHWGPETIGSFKCWAELSHCKGVCPSQFDLLHGEFIGFLERTWCISTPMITSILSITCSWSNILRHTGHLFLLIQGLAKVSIFVIRMLIRHPCNLILTSYTYRFLLSNFWNWIFFMAMDCLFFDIWRSLYINWIHILLSCKVVWFYINSFIQNWDFYI